eukprot:TRINITY_DN8620_c0_g1_i9.p1 TRINITY_DN8620_c0_g1~~TRINITY_DN8620_c0_g1_i9.p1  ORF type:complete len:657 (-),score=133.69 TRINITY_DN8620_c0_g1_i9:334-2304(-)
MMLCNRFFMLLTSLAVAALAGSSSDRRSFLQAENETKEMNGVLAGNRSSSEEHEKTPHADCGGLDAPQNQACKEVATWAATSGKADPEAPLWYKKMKRISGLEFAEASQDDFQRLYFCAPPGGKKFKCGMPPCRCTNPPCHVCAKKESVASKMKPKVTRGVMPPKTPFEYNGMEWPKMTIKGTGEMHIFAVGDWGGLAGEITDSAMIIQYLGGERPGPHTMGRYRIDEKTREGICLSGEMINCMGTKGKKCTGDYDKLGASLVSPTKCCPHGCGYTPEVDVRAQTLVAKQMEARAKTSKPDYILNVGDNFYWGGIDGKCGETPMSTISEVTATQFKWIFENMYSGPGLDGKPWLSVLGNHDWGGRTFFSAWDQQIAYTWVSDRWILPAVYWMQHVEYPDLDFSVDFYMTDSNIVDAHADPGQDPASNICSGEFNGDESCSSVGGPPDRKGCHSWFQKLWDEGAEWVTEKLKKSTSDWQILVTHFPCGHEEPFYKKLHEDHGLDLLVTGHTHKQQWWEEGERKRMGGLPCFITGGGGGIVSESPPDRTSHDTAYGFYDLIISKNIINIESINWEGKTVGKWSIKPGSGVTANSHDSSSALRRGKLTESPSQTGSSKASVGSCKVYPCGTYASDRMCQCNDKCSKYANCCTDYAEQCT